MPSFYLLILFGKIRYNPNALFNLGYPVLLTGTFAPDLNIAK